MSRRDLLVLFGIALLARIAAAWLIDCSRYVAIVLSTMPVVGRRTTSGPAPRAPVAMSSQPTDTSSSQTRDRRDRVPSRPPLAMVVTTFALSIAPRAENAVVPAAASSPCLISSHKSPTATALGLKPRISLQKSPTDDF